MSANAAVGVPCPTNTLPSLSTVNPSADPSPEIKAVPATKSTLYVALLAALRISMFASAFVIVAANVIAPAAFVIVIPEPAVKVATDAYPVVALPISNCPFVDIAAVAAIVSSALA